MYKHTGVPMTAESFYEIYDFETFGFGIYDGIYDRCIDTHGLDTRI